MDRPRTMSSRTLSAAVAAFALLLPVAGLAAPLGTPALDAIQAIRSETGEITVNGSPVTVVRYTWRDSVGAPRSVALVPASPSTAGYAVRMTYQVNDGGVRTVNIDADPAADGGFGYFVSHELYRDFVGGGSGTIAGLHGADDSPLGRYLPSTGSSSSVGQTQAVHEFRFDYPRWGTVASIPDPSTTLVSPALDQHQFFPLPVTIRWSFVAGTDYPLWSVEYDLTSAGDHVSHDVRGPYGTMVFNESSGPAVTALRWGDKYVFSADAGSADFGATAITANGLSWTWNAANTGRRYNALSAGAYEFGLVETVPFANSRYGDGYADRRGSTKAVSGGCGYGLLSMPCDYEWAYQSFQYDYGPPARPKIAWGSSPFLGSSLTTVYVNGTQTESIVPQGRVHYGVHIVFGRSTAGAPLTLARAATPLEPNPALTVSRTPIQGGEVGYRVLGASLVPQMNPPIQALMPWDSVSIMATPATGYAFAGWSGACAGVAGPTCLLTLDQSHTVTALFTPTIARRGDSNGDAMADLFWREAAPGTGLSWWLMNGSVASSSNYYPVGSEWQIADVGDLDGDGKADLVWRRTTDGAAYLWTLNGLGFKGFFDLGVLDPAVWTLVGAADLDGNGKSDLLWRKSDGTLYGWLMNGGAIASQGVIGNPGLQWQVIDLADMDGDGKADIVFRNTVTGQVYVWFMNGLAVAGSGSPGALDPAQWTLLAAADFDGDGKADLLWRSATGDTWVWLMNGAAYVAGGSIGNPGAGWSIQSVADFDGDGKADLIWRHTSGAAYFWRMYGASVASAQPVANPGGTWQIVAP